MSRSLRLLVICLFIFFTSVVIISAQDDTQPTGLQVSDVFPSFDTADNATDTAITVIFNRPVVPLVTVDDMEDLPDPIEISPSVEGTGEWINTSIYIFTPTEGLAGGTTYEVTVPAGLTAVDGSVLEEPYVWIFDTTKPAVLSFLPRPQAGDVRLDSKIQVTFNMPMDRESVEAEFELVPLLQLDEGDPVAGTFSWSANDTGFSFTPDDDLQLDQLYLARLGNPTAKNTDVTIEDVNEWSFATVPFPAIVGSRPSDGDFVTPWATVEIVFASPMNIESLVDKIVIDPEPEQEPEYFYRDWSDVYSISFLLYPSAEYTVTVLPGAEDIYGNTIDEEFTFSFSTNPYEPEVTLLTPGPVGFYNGYREPIQLFVAHRNISQVEFGLYDVTLDTFLDYISEDVYYPGRAEFTGQENLVRNWTMPSLAPENAKRFDLVDLQRGGEVTCGTLTSRVRVGDVTRVISDPDPLRARSTPAEGEIVDLLYRDYSLPIVGGPNCIDDILWWEVELRDGQTAWVAEGLDDEYFIEVRIPTQVTETIVTDANGEDLAPGIYYLEAESPESFRNEVLQHILIVSTADLTMKTSRDSVTVWATDIESGKPLVDVPIQVYNQNGALVGTRTTDADGVATVEIPQLDNLYERVVTVLQDGTNFGLTASNWTDGIEPYQFQQNYDFYPRDYQFYLYTDRPVYRTDQPVYFRGVIRNKDDVTYTPIEQDTVPVTIRDDRGDEVYREDLPVTPFGTFSGQFDIAEDAPLGSYVIEVDLSPDDADYYYQRETGSVGFTVAEYRLPEFQVEAIPAESEVVQGDTIRVAVDATYFFGGSVSNANVDYNVLTDRHFFQYDGQGRYDFTDVNYDAGPSEFYGSSSGFIANGTGTTDENGSYIIEVPAEFKDSTQSQVYTIEAVVTDESNLAVAGRTNVVIHQGLVYVGVRPEQYVSREGEDSNIEMIVVDWDSEPIAEQEVDIEIVERRWSSVQEQDDSGRTTWTWEVEEIPVTDGQVTTDEDGKAEFSFVPPSGGVYKIIATTTDELGNEVRSSTNMWVSSSSYVSWRQQNSNRIDLIADKDEYSVGETASILIAHPFQGETEAWVTVERGDVLQSERLTLDSNSAIYELPITADFAPNIFVNVFIVKGVDEFNPVAAFRMGMIQLGVDIEQKEITIDIEADRDQAAPQETVTYTVKTSNYLGEPIVSEVGVGVTDLAALSLLGPNSGPILQTFYGQQGLSVRTASPLTINTDEITQTTLDTIKGGGGGFIDAGIVDIRGEFIDTPFWNGAIVTDANGEATFEVRLPDNLTTWRLDARAVTSGDDGLTLVGQDTFDLLSTRPLIVRPVTPRFFVVGDKLKLGAVVNNNTSDDLVADVTMQSTGLTVLDDITQTVTIPANGRARVDWSVEVNNIESTQIAFIADAGSVQDASVSPVSLDDEGTLPVYKYEVPETVGTSGMLREEGERLETIVLPDNFDVTQGNLNIKVDQSLAGATIDSLNYLENFPHQCVEQTVSRFLPNIMTYRALQSLDIEDEELSDNLEVASNFAIQKLIAEQKADGGWGWFVNDRSNTVTTAYALIGLSEALEQGILVDRSMIRPAQEYLRRQFIVPGLDKSEYQLNRQVFILYALARSGRPDVARTTTMFDYRDNLSIYAKSWLAETLYMINPEDTNRIETLVNDLLNDAVISATGMHWEEDYNDYWNWNTDTRTTAIALGTLVKIDPENQLLPSVVRHLMVQRQADSWETTQETAWAVMSLTDWMLASGELNPDYSYEVSLNDELLLEDTATRETYREQHELVIEVADLLKDEANRLLFSRSAGDGVLYYTTHLTAYLPVPEVEALDRGIIVDRRYTLLDDADNASITEAQVGDVVEVRLTIIAPNDLHYVVIEDPLPAGAEAINPDLDTSQQVGTMPGLDSANPLRYGWGWWWFSNIEFRDEKVNLYSTYLPAGTYEYVYTMRLGLEGEFNVIPVTGQEFYFPEVYGRSDGSVFTIHPAEDS